MASSALVMSVSQLGCCSFDYTQIIINAKSWGRVVRIFSVENKGESIRILLMGIAMDFSLLCFIVPDE